MRITLLGPLEVLHEGSLLVPSAPKQRALLALLLLNANNAVSAAQCAQELGDGTSRGCAVSTVHTHVMQVRKALGSVAKRLRTSEGGYRFTTRSMECDLDRFDGLISAARTTAAAGGTETAAAWVAEALSLWRTEALVDVRPGPVARQALIVLRAKRLDAVVLCIDLELRLGRHRQVLGKLTGLVHRHPADERLTAQLMTVLYRCGRQADALHAYQRFLASAEVASPALGELQTAILLADPVLEGPAGPPPVLGLAR